jgi:sulfur carrier protein
MNEGTPMSDAANGMTLTVNGQAEPLAQTTVAALVAARDIPQQRGVAVALNGAVVPRAAWRTTALRNGDVVEIVRALSGG